MNDIRLVHLLREACRSPQRRASVILFSSVLLLVTWRCFGTPDFFRQHWASLLPEGIDGDSAAACYRFIAGFVLLGLIPAMIVRLGFRQSLAEYGVQLGNRFLTFRSMLILVPLMVLIGWLSSRNASIADYYPLNPAAGRSPGAFALHAGTYLLYYLGWEFHFRGFLQLGLRDTMGDINSLLVQVMASTLLHIGHPTSEVYGAVAGGILWGVVLLWTRSLLSGLTQHAALGIALDAFLVTAKLRG